METVDSEIGDPSKDSLKQILWKSCSSTCSSTDDNVHIPQVKQECKPRLGQEFESLDDVYDFYNKYAKEAGFSVRINSSRKNRDNNEIVRKEYVCFKEGISAKAKGVVSETKRRRGITREGCNAKLAVVKSKTGTYTVSIFVEGHSHALTTPQRVHLLRSHRKELEAKKSVFQPLLAPNISKHQEISMHEMQQVGGIQTDGCMEKDICNCERDLRKELSGHDANMLCEHFLLEQEKNSGFIFEINRDDENQLTRCFWVDAISRRAYQYFGDVVVFDTICNANRHDMIFASMMGVNNHGQTITFACSFLSDKTVDSFVWLFEQFKKCMPNCSPKMIISDQDSAMAKAISQTLPDTMHTYCSWHIINKLSKQFEVSYRDYYSDFQNGIWESCTREEFDSKWKEVIENCNLNDDTWLHSMFEIRSKWVPAYVNHVFSAGMLGSQQSEFSRAFFKSCVSKKNSLVDFIVLFDRVLIRQRSEELTADLVDINEKPCLKLPVEIEKQMAEIYTRTVFYKFQDELWNSLLYKIDFVRGSVNHSVYTAEKKNEGVCESREIVYRQDLDFASCSCKKFESEGLPCRHILAYLNRMQITCLPNQYIMKRWTKAAKSTGNFDDGLEINDYSDKSFLVRRTRLFQLASTVIDKVAFSDEASKILEEALDHVLQKMESVVGYGGISKRNSTT